jgi:pimeloyl-ACP methyl ester carboxylesterase
MLEQAPADLQVEAVALLVEPLGYTALAQRMSETLALAPDDVLVAESFSGPLAVLLAARTRVAALVLVNSFVVPPRSRLWRHLAHTVFFRLPPPNAVLRRYFLGENASDKQLSEMRRAIRAQPPEVLATRLASIFEVDVRAELAQGRVLLLDLRGSEDLLVLPQSRTTIVATAPDRVSAVTVQGPHLLLEAAPVLAWQAITEFLRRHLAS